MISFKAASMPVTLSIAASDEPGCLVGYLSTFDNVDRQQDAVGRGAFDSTLAKAQARKERSGYLWPLFASHDLKARIGWIVDAVVDEVGLLVKARLDFSSTRAVALYRVMKQDKTALSFSMGYRASRYRQDGDVRWLLEVDILEGSTTPTPANTQAVLTGVKSLRRTILDMTPVEAEAACEAALDQLASIQAETKADEGRGYFVEVPDTAVPPEKRLVAYTAFLEAKRELQLPDSVDLIWLRPVDKRTYEAKQRAGVYTISLRYDDVYGVQHWGTDKVCVVDTHLDLERLPLTVRHEARHWWQFNSPQAKGGGWTHARAEEDAERYATGGLAAVRRRRFDLSTEAGRKAALFATMRPDGTYLTWQELSALEFYDEEEAA